MRLSFHGADRSVTGSCHLVEAAGAKILVDCGFYQGGRTAEAENADDFGFDPPAIDILVLTHAHLDHCGRIPLLVKRGFKGEIVATAATRELARIVLIDAAHLQEEEHRRALRIAARRGEPEEAPAPLYTLVDALNAFDRFGRVAEYRRPLDLVPGVRATFHNAGHILGSASVKLEAEENGARRTIVFSGDLGNPGRPLLADPDPPQGADALVMESTYGDRNHRSLAASLEEFYGALNASHHGGGNIVIPTFALERAQELLYWLRDGVEQNRLAPGLHVFLDSPMAISATEIFGRYPADLAAPVGDLIKRGIDPFRPPGLRFTREASESEALNRLVGGAILMAGSGMCTGGRVVHHLRHNLGRPNASVIFVGFAAEGTLAREIIDGARSVRIFGEPIRVRAKIYTINGFSAHAGQAELVDWRSRVAAKRTFLTHGEPPAMDALAKKLGGDVTCPQRGEAFEI
jgi:metallo-beta-lactamase family protein